MYSPTSSNIKSFLAFEENFLLNCTSSNKIKILGEKEAMMEALKKRLFETFNDTRADSTCASANLYNIFFVYKNVRNLGC